MRIKTIGNKGDSALIVVRNADTASMPIGTPVIFAMNGTNDGLDVVLPATAGASKVQAMLCGIIATPGGVAVNTTGEVVAYGLHTATVLTRQTRSASTVSWASEASIASYVQLQPETVANGMQTVGGTVAASAFIPYGILVQSLASYSSSASSTADTRTAITAAVRAFFRIM